MGDERAGMVKVDLSKDEWDQHAAKLAELEAERISINELKATHNRGWNERLKQLKTDIAVETEAVETHKAWVPAQAGLFGGGDESANDTEEEPEAAPARGGRRGRRGGRRAAEAAVDA